MMNSDDFPGQRKNVLHRWWYVLLLAIAVAVIPLILLYVFGFSIKTSDEYDCAIRMAEQSAQVIAVTGEPITPGLFAWTRYFESGPGLRQGYFSTAVSGPRGRGTLYVHFYRTPIGASFDVWFESGRQRFSVYSGDYRCP